jgi:hypothetical protein
MRDWDEEKARMPTGATAEVRLVRAAVRPRRARGRDMAVVG